MKIFILSISIFLSSLLLLQAEEKKVENKQPPQTKELKKTKTDEAAKEDKAPILSKARKSLSELDQILLNMDLRGGAKLGTLGLGLYLSTPIKPKHHIRFNINAMAFDDTATEDALDYEAEVTYLSAGILYDFYPNNGKLRITTGLYYNGNKADIENQSTGNFSLNGTTYNLSKGDLRGEVKFNPIAPYVGIGYDHAIMDHKQWSFSLDLGLFYQGDADVNVDVSGASALQANIQSNADAEAKELEDDLNHYSYYPVIAFGITYRY